MKALWLAVILAPMAQAATPQAGYGILLLAHGGAPEWNAEVGKIASELGAMAPTETALGMADRDAIQNAVDNLTRRGAKRIVALPLFVSSNSEVLDQTRYLLGLRSKPSEVLEKALAAMGHTAHHHHMSFSRQRIKLEIPVAMTSALDDDSLVADILLDHAKALSKNPEQETVFIVGHGPVDEKANSLWLKTLGNLARKVCKKGGFKAARALTLRDDSPEPVRNQAIATMRAAIGEASQQNGKAIVIPDLIARGGIETHIAEALKGIDCAWDGQALLPHPNIALWAKKRIRMSEIAVSTRILTKNAAK